MLLATDSTSWTSILAAVVSIFGTSFIGLIAYIFHETRKDLQNDVANLRETIDSRLNDVIKQIERNSKHIDSVMASYWPILWRLNGMEDYLGDADRPPVYKSPRIIGETETRFREKD